MNLESAAQVESLLAKPYPTQKEVEAFCNDARLAGYRGVVVPSSLVELAYELLADEGLKVSCLVGYPFGQAAADVKRYEVEAAVDAGAHEIELVPSIAGLVEGKYGEVLREIRDVVEAADERPVKVAMEVALWSEGQLGEVAKMLLDSGAQYVSTSVAPSVRRPIISEDVKRIRSLVGEKFGVKVGGLKEVGAVESFLGAGANLVGLLV